MIELNNCSFLYQNADTAVVKNLNLHIKSGECIVLCGKSGCGKTTITRLLNGLSPEYFSGELTGNCTTFGLEAGKSKIEDYVPIVGSVFQNPKTQHFNIDTTAELAFPCENMGMASEDIRKRVYENSRDFGIEYLLNRNIFNLSGGEKQKIAFGTACMLNPRLLVLDEPTSNLDYKAIDDLHEMIVKKKEEGVTIVIAEHRLAWLVDVADRFCYFENGELVEQWSSDEFQSIPSERLQSLGLRSANLEEFRKKTFEKSKIDCLNSNAIITIDQLDIGYNKKSPVKQIEKLHISKGEIVGLMGHNGCGKSTFAKTLCGLIKPLRGTILPKKEKERLKQSFMVMQDVNYQLFSDSVREEVLLGAKYPEMCEEVLEALRLSEMADRHPMSLSGGQKQRVAIASAILSGKDLILLDEPTSGLDYYHMTKVAQLLEFLKQQGAAVLVITHDEELAAGWCDRVIDISKGEQNYGI